jgi:hypothetical protein
MKRFTLTLRQRNLDDRMFSPAAALYPAPASADATCQALQ